MTSLKLKEDFLVAHKDEDFYDLKRNSIRNVLDHSKSNAIKFSDLELKVREKGVIDFPNFTQSHGVVANMIRGIIVKSRSVIDFPNPTNCHRELTNLIGLDDIEKAPNVVDLGCGAGFIGNYVGKNVKVNKLIFNDFSPDAIEHTKGTYELNSRKSVYKTPENNIEFREGDAKDVLSDVDTGIGFCAPYLIPYLCEEFPGVYSLFADVAKKQGLDLYIAFSNLASGFVDEAVQISGMNPELVHVHENLPFFPEYLDRRKQVDNSEEGRKKLFEENIEKLKKLGLVKSNSGDFYLHDVKVLKLS